jgi:hypothetical protein
MHDTSLDELCRRQPNSIQELLSVPGFGVKKAETYGLKILEAFNKFGSGARADVRVEKISRPAEETIRLLAPGKVWKRLRIFASGNSRPSAVWLPI